MRSGRTLIIVALMATAFGLRLAIDEPGPLFLLPTVLGALWFGRLAGMLIGLSGAAAYALASWLGPMGDVTVTALTGRAVLFAFAGYLVGRLGEERGSLVGEVERQDVLLSELSAIQQALTPAGTPRRPGLEIGAVYHPAVEMAAGDFYLVAEGPSSETTVVAVGDVVGKGVEAARRATFVRTAIAVSAPFSDDPRNLLELANSSLVERAGESADFVTAICVVYDGSRQSVAWASAGHPPPLRLADGAQLEGETGRPLGIRASLNCPVAHAPLRRGSGLLLFTDGLTEAKAERQDGGSDLFGYERVKEVLAQAGGAGAAEIARRLVAAAERFSAPAASDDICVVTLRVLPSAG